MFHGNTKKLKETAPWVKQEKKLKIGPKIVR